MSAGTEDQPSTATKYESITVKLSQNDGSSASTAFPVRNIRFTAAQPKVHIGRASKTVSKGLTPAEDNAYFDIPVMSREHAEMTADLDEGLIFLRDNRSLHGTSVNGISLPHESLQRLNNGDSILFGIHVARGLEVFNPASVLVNITPHVKSVETPSRAYTAPDPTDEMSDVVSEADCTNSVRFSSVESDGMASDPGMHAPSDSGGESVRIVSPTPAAKEDNKAPSVQPEDYGETESVAEVDHHEENDHSSYRFPSEEVDSEDISTNYSSDDDSDLDEVTDGMDEVIETGGADEVEEADEAGEVEMAREIHEDDDGSAFLAAEIARFKNSMLSVDHRVVPRAVAEPTPVDGLWTPPSASAAHSSDEVGPSDEDAGAQKALHVHAEDDGQAADNASASSPSLPPVSTLTKKYNISSILNPSPPPSSPSHVVPISASGYEARDGELCHVATSPRVVISSQVAQPSCLLAEPSPLFSEIASVPAAAQPRILPEVPGQDFEVIDMLEFFRQGAGAKKTDVNAAKEDEEYAMTSAATFSAWKKKRKADEMLEDSAEADAAEAAAAPVAVPAAANTTSDSLPAASPAKRPATEAAMQTNRKLKKVAWAIAEKVGIAALGGAVVLGSLIYTAPSF